MPRNHRLYLDDMQQALTRIIRYVGTQDYTAFMSNDQLVDAVMRNFEILGEAVKHLPDSIRQRPLGVKSPVCAISWRINTSV